MKVKNMNLWTLEQLSSYREDKSGQVLQEGITEAGAMSSWIAAGTSYTNHDIEMIPIYIFYSMFGFQRVGDLAWAAGDSQARGFLIGATAGRTTLAGEGLQHQDGHSHLMASNIPNCVSYDPTFAYEMAVILRDGIKRMHEKKENIFYYITAMNENYPHPEKPKDADSGILKGMYLFEENNNKGKTKVQLLGSGTILREIIAAAKILSKDYGIDSDVWSVTSFNELRKDGMETERWNLLNPDEKRKKSYVQKCMEKRDGPIIAASDYVRSFSDQIRPYIQKPFYSFGTDGYGRSDTRKKLRKFFEIDKEHIVAYTLSALANEQLIASKHAEKAFKKYKIDKKRYCQLNCNFNEMKRKKTKLASPKVRKFARELGTNIIKIKGSQRSGRISEEDVKNFIKKQFSDVENKENKEILKNDYNHDEFGK